MKMKSFLANKNKDQEVRIHEFEAAVIKNNEKIKVCIKNLYKNL